MSALDELAGRMDVDKFRRAVLRFLEAPENGLKFELTKSPPRPAGIPWVPIAEMPEEWKDGREVLLWVPDGPREPHQFGRYAGAEAPEMDYWLTGDNIPLWPTHVATLNPPEGV